MSKETIEDVDIQPTGASVERTLDVVGYILADVEFANRVVGHNGWPAGLDQKDIALLFLASRYQWSIDLLSLRTNTLMREVGGVSARLDDLEGGVRGQ